MEAAAQTSDQRVVDQAEQAARVGASWRERALNAEDALKHAHTEIALQRDNIGQLLGKIRDLENDLPEDGVQRIVTANTTLKQQVRQLTQDKRRLEERLTGARDNNRFWTNGLPNCMPNSSTSCRRASDLTSERVIFTTFSRSRSVTSRTC